MKLQASFLLVFLLPACFAAHSQRADIAITDTGKTIISKDIYGQFAEHLGRSIYDGFYRNGKIRTDVVAALQKIRVPNLRWPGGCFADQYHWREGVGPKSDRPKTVNSTWGMVTEDNSFGTDEFLELCRLIGCEPYFAGNVGTGSPQEMKDWIEYLSFAGNSAMADLRARNGHALPYRISLWGVGNESWGCGGNMTPEHYADLYKQYATFCFDYPGTHLRRIASGQDAADYHWTEVLMKSISVNAMQGISLHYYTFPSGHWDDKGSATAFSESEYAHSLVLANRMEEIVEKQEAIMDRYDPAKKVGLYVDEWGVWANPEPGTPDYAMYQQGSLRDALVAATTLNIFNNHADRIRGANLAQTVNVIHSLILTQDDKMVLTPSYFVFELYKVHQNARLMPVKITSPWYVKGTDSLRAVNASASIDTTGSIHITLVNLDPNHEIPVRLQIPGVKRKTIAGSILTAPDITAINTFQNSGSVHLQAFDKVKIDGDGLMANLPPKAVVLITIK